MTKIAYTPKEAAAECGVGVDLVKDSIRTRQLPARDAEGEPVVVHDDLERWASTLPAWNS
jgi:hypothetical protein